MERSARHVTEVLVVARTDWTVLGVGEDEGVRVMGNVYGLVGCIGASGDLEGSQKEMTGFE